MNAAVESLGADLRALQPSLPGNELDWLRSRREAALVQFEARGLPTLRDEDWKYTSIRSIERRALRLASTNAASVDANAAVTLAEERGYVLADSTVAVLRDGEFIGIAGQLAEGLRVVALADAVADARLQALLNVHLGRIATPGTDGFAASSASALRDGLLIHIGAGASVEQPLVVLHIDSGTEDQMSAPRCLIVADEGSSIRVVEHNVSERDGAGLVNQVTEIALADAATLEHTKLQEQSHTSFHVSTLEASIARNAKLTSHALSVGGAIARHDLNAHLLGEGGRCEMNGLYLGTGKQHVDFHTRIHHRAAKCSSSQTYKGILDGNSRGVFNGQVHVHPDAQQSDAQQANHNLLLSKNAEIDTKPQLEILADDVTCSHGATVGQLDADMLFYLRSRGVPDVQARGLLTYGFAHDIVERLSISTIAARMEHLLVEVLPNGDELKNLVETD
jgi:Fe-S cluster assembly protein SufD